MQPAEQPGSRITTGGGRLLAGVDVGGTKIAVVLADTHGDILSETTASAPKSGGADVLRTAADLVSTLEREVGERADAVGVGAAGIIDSASGTVLAASNLFDDWAGRAIGPQLQGLLGRPVTVANDVNAFLLGEARWGALVDAPSALGIMLGTGVGGAVMLEGRLFEGSGGGAGEIGHTPRYSDRPCTCGGIGHLETVASGRSLGLRYAQLADVPPVSGEQAATLAKDGNMHAQQAFEEAGEALGNAVLAASTLYDVDFVVIGGGVANAWDLWGPAFDATIDANPPVSGRPLVVRKAQLRNPALGAASLAAHLAQEAVPA